MLKHFINFPGLNTHTEGNDEADGADDKDDDDNRMVGIVLCTLSYLILDPWIRHSFPKLSYGSPSFQSLSR